MCGTWHADVSRAMQQGKPIIAVKVEARYKPSDWLADLCHGGQVYDLFDRSQNFIDNEWNRLRATLEELNLPVNTTTGTSTGLTWTCYMETFHSASIHTVMMDVGYGILLSRPNIAQSTSQQLFIVHTSVLQTSCQHVHSRYTIIIHDQLARHICVTVQPQREASIVL